MAASTHSGFYIAPYGIDGKQVDLGFRETSRLSSTCLGVCTEFLNAHGAVFDASWGGKLNELRTKVTSASGSAIATFFVRDGVASSILLLSGQSPEVDHSVTEMFVESFRRNALVQRAASSPHPFSTVAALNERPLMVAVAWPDPTILDQEQELARELGIHLAGAFLSSVMDNH